MSEKNKKPKIIVVLGPTASGKSDIAVKLARKYNGEIISADSRQVYKGLDIGTGKITKKEKQGVKHYLLDVCSPSKRFSAADFKKLGEKVIVKIVEAGKIPIICGGTGFYIDALLGDKQIPEVPPNWKLREKLEKKNTTELFEILKKIDPERAKNIDSKNPRRLIRAIEICEALGEVPPLRPASQDFTGQAKIESRIMNYEICKIGIAPITPSPTPSSYIKRKGLQKPTFIIREDGKNYLLDEKLLKEKINKRIDKWFKQGLLREIENLHKKGLSWKRMTEIGLEYKIVSDFLRRRLRKKVSKVPFDTLQLKKEMSEKTWAYAKRQMTWFKKDKNIKWISGLALPEL